MKIGYWSTQTFDLYIFEKALNISLIYFDHSISKFGIRSNLGFDFEVTSSGTFDKLGGESAEEAPESVPGEDCFEDSPVK